MGGNKLYLTHEFSFLAEKLLARVGSLFSGVVLCVGCEEGNAVTALMRPLLEQYQITVVEDRASDRGPLEGLRQGLSAMRTEWGFLLACDMPMPQEAVIRQIWSMTPAEAQTSVVRLDGYLMALHGFYRADCLPCIDVAIERAAQGKRGGARIVSFYDAINVNVVEEESLALLPGYKKSFANANTQEELKRIMEG